MFKLMNTALIPIVIGLTAYSLTPAIAQTAGGGNSSGGSGSGSDPFVAGPPATHVPRRPKISDRDAGCGYREALAKASRMGISRGQIERSVRASITVAGRRDGSAVSVRFAREAGCPIIRENW